MFTPGIIAANFVRLDDTDILASAKYWTDHSDKVLSDLAGRLINRNLFAIELQNDPFPEEKLTGLKKMAGDLMKISPEHLDYYVYAGTISNLAYTPDAPEVKILLKNGKTDVISSVSICLIRDLYQRVTKYFICYPKECG